MIQKLQSGLSWLTGWGRQAPTPAKPEPKRDQPATGNPCKTLFQRELATLNTPSDRERAAQIWADNIFSPSKRSLYIDRKTLLTSADLAIPLALRYQGHTKKDCINLGTRESPRRYPAHHIPMENCNLPRNLQVTLAEAPFGNYDPSVYLFLELLYRHASALVILEDSSDYFRQLHETEKQLVISGQSYSFSVPKQLTETGIEQSSLLIKRTRTRQSGSKLPVIFVHDWEDMQDYASFSELVAKVKPLEQQASGGKNVVIHCRAGVGRSGTLTAALALELLFDTGTITNRETFETHLIKITDQGKTERGPGFIMRPCQFEMLYEYGISRLEQLVPPPRKKGVASTTNPTITPPRKRKCRAIP